MSEMIDGCPMCEGMQATTWMITHLRPPVTLQSCEEHAAQNLVVTLATIVDVDPAWLYEVVSTAVNGAADEFAMAQAVTAEPDEIDDDGDPGHISHDTAGQAGSKPKGRARARRAPDLDSQAVADEVQGA